MIDIKKLIQIEMIKHDIPSMSAIAKRCGWFPQSLDARLKNKTLRVDDLQKIADAMDCDLDIQFNDRK